jgi:UrcA family protein
MRSFAMLKRILAAALLAAGVPAIAPAQDVYPEVRVPYRDLDLRHAAGVKAFDSRLRRAVKAVCPYDVSADRWTQIAARRCLRTTGAAVAASREAVLEKAAWVTGPMVASAR